MCFISKDFVDIFQSIVIECTTFSPLSQLSFSIQMSIQVLWTFWRFTFPLKDSYAITDWINSLHEIFLSLYSSIPDDAGKRVPCYHPITES